MNDEVAPRPFPVFSAQAHSSLMRQCIADPGELFRVFKKLLSASHQVIANNKSY